MNPNATITDVQFQDFLRKVRDLVEGPYTEWQKEIEVTNKFPEKFYQSNNDNDIYRYSLPVEYGGWGLNEKEILQVQEEFSRGPSGMRMHMHYASEPELAYPRRLRSTGSQREVYASLPGQDHLHQLRSY